MGGWAVISGGPKSCGPDCKTSLHHGVSSSTYSSLIFAQFSLQCLHTVLEYSSGSLEQERPLPGEGEALLIWRLMSTANLTRMMYAAWRRYTSSLPDSWNSYLHPDCESLRASSADPTLRSKLSYCCYVDIGFAIMRTDYVSFSSRHTRHMTSTLGPEVPSELRSI